MNCSTGFMLVALMAMPVAACSRSPMETRDADGAVPITAAPVTVGVEGRRNANASVAVRDGRVVVAWAASGDGGSDIFTAVSQDGGAHFGAPVRVNDAAGDASPSGEQPPRVALGSDAIHVVWPSQRGGAAIRYARSVDGGLSYGTAVTVPRVGAPGARGWESIALATDGTIHLVWLDGRAAAHTHVPGADAHAGAEAHAAGADAHAPGADAHAPGMADPRQDVYHAAWRAGLDVREELIASNVCFCCKTGVAVSARGISAVWRHLYPEHVRDIAFARSENGRPFSAPVRVSRDEWQLDGCPDDGPAIAIDALEVIRVAWPTLVPGPAPRKGIFLATSSDGRAFAPRVRVDSGSGDPAHPQIAIVGDASAIVWDELGGGERRIMMRLVPADGSVTGKPAAISTEQSASYPSIAAAGSGAVVAWTGVTLDRSVIRVRRVSQP